MKQLTFVAAGELAWREVREPKLEGDGEALVRALTVATCDLDRFYPRASSPPGASSHLATRASRRWSRSATR
jgi:hypothetical protein